MKLFEACVYTIVDEDDLLRADRGREPSDQLSEGKPWSKVAGWLAEAKDRDERVAIVFADAKHVLRWLGWAVLTDDLSIDPPGQRQRATRYRFQNLRPLLGHPRSEFALLQTGDPLPASHIRPYVHFRTPEFLRQEAAQEDGLLLSEWLRRSTREIEQAEELRTGAEAIAGPFDPHDERDGRLRIMGNLVRRQGQAVFRRELFRVYRGRCAITGCEVEHVLEAVHIMPYRGEHTNHVCNGILLRSDLHVLFDLHLFAIDPDSYSIIIGPKLARTPYAEFDGKKLCLPEKEAYRPDRDALRSRLSPG